jgi:phosphoribosyl-ATP pyrophosphohydrolase
MTEEILIVKREADGASILDVVACNEKSRAKSLEQNELWIVDRQTGRVLPYRGGGVRAGTAHRCAGWWEVVVTGELLEESASSAAAATTRRADAAPAPAEALADAATGRTAAPDSGVLAHLTETIRTRHQTMHEGSYTTHLFAKGADKIRKKTGEEAVELILARESGEIVSEAADLVYHMMVLLEVEGLTIDAVLAELARRHAE